MTARELLESISVVVAVDGKLASEEKEYLYDVARQLRVSGEELSNIFELVRAGEGRIATPTSQSDQVELYTHLLKAASADGNISEEESKLLKEVGELLGLQAPDRQIRHIDRSETQITGHKQGIQKDTSVKNVLDAFPQQPASHESEIAGTFNKVYVLPLILLGLCAITFIMYYIHDAQSKIPEVSTAPINQKSLEERVADAKIAVERGDKLWDDGFKGWNDRYKLGEALASYLTAWFNITGQDWKNGKENIQSNTDAKPLVDSDDTRILKSKLVERIPALERALNGNPIDGWF